VIDLLAHDGIKIDGMIESGVAAAKKLKPSRLGLIGGRRTVLSGTYRRAFGDQGIRVEQRIAQPLSGLIESGDISSDRLRSEAKRILSPIRNCSHILLACTHYPAISALLKEFVSEGTVLIDPSNELVKRLKPMSIKKDKDIFLTSGSSERMKKAAMNAFGVSIKDVRRVNIK